MLEKSIVLSCYSNTTFRQLYIFPSSDVKERKLRILLAPLKYRVQENVALVVCYERKL